MIRGKTEGGPVFREMSQAEGALLLPKGFPRSLFERKCPNGVGRRVIDSCGQELRRRCHVVVDH
ncbi:MAG: hypothetical protein EWM73_02406 [Nitrospira sp.]|nr:MAG: hypothetical protein EWM73_02406 [Nitrospira sp.]